MDSGKIIKEGSVNVRGSLKLWSQRYAVLYSTKKICIFKSKKHYAEKKSASAVLSIENAQSSNADSETKKDYSFKVVESDGKEKFFQAVNDSDRQSWLNAIKRVMNGDETRATPSPSFSEAKPPAIISSITSTGSISSTKSTEAPKESPKKETKPTVPLTAFSKERLEKLFEDYQDKEEEYETPTIGPSGIEKLCKDVGVDPEDVIVLVFAWSIGAKKMGFFERPEFVAGLEKLNCDTVEKIKAKLQDLKKNLTDDIKFKEIYKWSFNFAKEPTQRAIEAELAVGLLKLLTKERKGKFPHCEEFCEFLTTTGKYKVINMDHWMSFYQFNTLVKPDLSNFNAEDAWPTMFDDFAEWRKNKGKESKGEQPNSDD